MRSVALAIAVCAATSVWADDIGIARNVAYGPAPHERMDVYSPTDITDATSVLVFFFGGGWQMGSKEALGSLGRDLARNGVIFVAPDYRLWPEVTFPAFLDDCAAALGHAVASLTRADGTARAVFVGGWSAGAYNALGVGLDQQRLSAHGLEPAMLAGAIGLAGPYRGGLCFGQPCPEVFPPESQPHRRLSRLIDKDDPPFLLLAGDRDSYVDLEHFDEMRQAAAAAGLEHTAILIENGYHRSLLRNLGENGTPERNALNSFLTAQAQRRGPTDGDAPRKATAAE